MLKVLFRLLPVLMLIVGLTARSASAQEDGKALDAAQRATVRVIVLYFDANKQIQAVSTGSGFIVAPGDVVTNAHVVSNNESAYRFIYVVPHRDVATGGLLGQVLDASEDVDLALISVPGLTGPVLDITDAMPTKESVVHALGYPGVTDAIRDLPVAEIVKPSEPYVTQGSIALFSEFAPGGRRLQTIFHTAAVNPGNSGGPLVDACGRVIGVNTWTAGASFSGDQLNIPTGQFIATRSSNLIRYLKLRGLAPQVTDAPCVVTAAPDPALLARLNAAESNLAVEKAQRTADEAAAKADKARSHVIWGLVGAVLAVAAVVGLALRYGRGTRTGKDSTIIEAPVTAADIGQPSAAVQSDIITHPPKNQNVGLVIIGLAGTGLIVAVTAYWLYARQGSPAAAPAAHAAMPYTEKATLVCEIDPARSRNPAPGAGALTLTFDRGRSCVNDRTAYERSPEGFTRTIVVGGTRTISRTLLSDDLTTLRRDDYILNADAYRRLLASRAGIELPLCSTAGGLSADAARSVQALRTTANPFTHGTPDRAMTWRCRVQTTAP